MCKRYIEYIGGVQDPFGGRVKSVRLPDARGFTTQCFSIKKKKIGVRDPFSGARNASSPVNKTAYPESFLRPRIPGFLKEIGGTPPEIA